MPKKLAPGLDEEIYKFYLITKNKSACARNFNVAWNTVDRIVKLNEGLAEQYPLDSLLVCHQDTLNLCEFGLSLLLEKMGFPSTTETTTDLKELLTSDFTIHIESKEFKDLLKLFFEGLKLHAQLRGITPSDAQTTDSDSQHFSNMMDELHGMSKEDFKEKLKILEKEV